VRVLVRESILGGELGDVQQVAWTHVSSGSRVPLRRHGWLFDRTAGGGWVGAWGSHTIDTLRWWFGDLVVVAASLRTDVVERPDASGALRRCDADDGFEALLRTEAGADVAISSTFAAPASVAPRVTVVGSDGVLEVVAESRITLRRADGSREERAVPAAEPGVDPHLVPMRRWAEAVRDLVRGGAEASGAPDFHDGLACARVLDAIRAAGGQPA
jgi:predicted dehydrogenase